MSGTEVGSLQMLNPIDFRDVPGNHELPVIVLQCVYTSPEVRAFLKLLMMRVEGDVSDGNHRRKGLGGRNKWGTSGDAGDKLTSTDFQLINKSCCCGTSIRRLMK